MNEQLADKPLRQRVIFLCCPWGRAGGGMYKLADYLLQSQSGAGASAYFRALDTRGNGSAAASMLVLLFAIGQLFLAQMRGVVAGVHVNMAERLSVFRKGGLMLVARLLCVPVVLHLHAAQLPAFYFGLPPALRALVRRIFSLADACIVLGEVARTFVCQELGIEAHRVMIIANGVPQPTVARRMFDPIRPFHFLFLGNLMERKGTSDVLHALASDSLRDAHWIATFAGDFDTRRYHQLAHSLKISEKVEFLGWIAQQEANALLADADALVLPSYAEGLPLVILEAMANGVAVVCTPVGEIPSNIGADVVAFVAPGDRPGLASTLRSLMTDNSLRENLEAAGRGLYLERFSLDAFSRAIARVHLRYFGVAGLAALERTAGLTQTER